MWATTRLSTTVANTLELSERTHCSSNTASAAKCTGFNGAGQSSSWMLLHGPGTCYLHIYMWISTHVLTSHVSVHIHICTDTNTYMNIHTHTICIHTHIHTSTSLYIYIYMYTYVYVEVKTHICIHKPICVDLHTYCKFTSKPTHMHIHEPSHI